MLGGEVSERSVRHTQNSGGPFHNCTCRSTLSAHRSWALLAPTDGDSPSVRMDPRKSKDHLLTSGKHWTSKKVPACPGFNLNGEEELNL